MTGRSLLLPMYRMTSSGFRPLVPLLLRWRRRNGQEESHRIKERMGIAGLPRPAGRLVWLHAASTGDGRTLLPLIHRLGARGFNVLVSTRTLAAAHALKRMLPAGALHQLMPMDVPAYVERFLDHWKPDMVLLAGAELWPNILFAARHRDLPVIFVNARMSDRVFFYCRRMRGAVAELMRSIDLCLARGELDAERFIELGAATVQTVGDLVFDEPLPGVDPVELSALSSLVGARPVWIAAMTESDETEIILDVHRRLLPSYPDLVTIIVPRLTRDGAVIVAEAARQNLAMGLRSRDGWPRKLPGLFVADVAGEAGLFYRASDIAFVGHSMTSGGRSPIEAAKLGCAILHGPSVDLHAEIYAALDAARGAATVADAAVLARVLSLLLDDGAKLRQMQRNAAQTMDRLCGGTSRIMRAIEPHVMQMLVAR